MFSGERSYYTRSDTISRNHIATILDNKLQLWFIMCTKTMGMQKNERLCRSVADCWKKVHYIDISKACIWMYPVAMIARFGAGIYVIAWGRNEVADKSNKTL